MVFGIGEGKIEIVLPKLNYTYGEKINGKVVLTLNQPKNAKGLRIELRAERSVWKNKMSGGKSRQVHKIETVYSFVLPLKGEGQFSSGEYNFEIIIPYLGLQQEESPAMKIGPFSFVDPNSRPLAWYLIASLDLPLSFDINKKLQISVSQGTQ